MHGFRSPGAPDIIKYMVFGPLGAPDMVEFMVFGHPGAPDTVKYRGFGPPGVPDKVNYLVCSPRTPRAPVKSADPVGVSSAARAKREGPPSGWPKRPRLKSVCVCCFAKLLMAEAAHGEIRVCVVVVVGSFRQMFKGRSGPR